MKKVTFIISCVLLGVAAANFVVCLLHLLRREKRPIVL